MANQKRECLHFYDLLPNNKSKEQAVVYRYGKKSMSFGLYASTEIYNNFNIKFRYNLYRIRTHISMQPTLACAHLQLLHFPVLHEQVSMKFLNVTED